MAVELDAVQLATFYKVGVPAMQVTVGPVAGFDSTQSAGITDIDRVIADHRAMVIVTPVAPNGTAVP